jgi:uncharacterized protein YajQ (UPF0234 family)
MSLETPSNAYRAVIRGNSDADCQIVQSALRLVQRQLQQNYTIRGVARKIGISHPSLLKLIDNPQRAISRMTAFRLEAYVKRSRRVRRRKYRGLSELAGRWVTDSV